VARFTRPHLETSLAFAPDSVLLVVSGEVDLATVAVLDDSLRRAESARRPVLLLDLSGVTFMDCAGLTALLAAARRAAEAGGEVSVMRATAPVRRLLRLTAVDQSLTVISA
jgi:anti-sigma B factor antagonist